MYTQYYGLQAQPFRLTPDPSYFFSSATHKSALAYMRYGMQQGEGFIVVTGDPGTGKTTLALTLIDGLPRNEMLIGELVTTQLQPDDLLRTIAAAFELDVEGSKSDLIVRLQAFFTARARAGKHILLVVDEAHDLPQASFEELRMLSNLHRGSQALLQCILLGQPPLRELLIQSSMDQFHQRVLAAHHLIPLSLNETRSYILHRLQQAGWHGNPSFTANAITLIHQYTQGVPRRVNALCTRLMLYGFIEEKHQIDEAATNQVYNEWMQELGQMGSVVPIRQVKLEEFNITGLTQEHVRLGRAVGADSHPVIDDPTERRIFTEKSRPAMTKPRTEDAISLNMQHTIMASSPAPAMQPDDLKTLSREAPSDPTLIDIISQRSYPLMPDSNQRSEQQAGTHSRLPWLLLTLIVLVAVVGAFYYLSDDSSYPQFIANKKPPQSRTQSAVAPQKMATAAPDTKQTHSAAQTPLRPEQDIPNNMAKSASDTKNISSVSTTPVMEPPKPAQKTPAGNTQQITETESDFAAMVPQASGTSPPEPVTHDTSVTHATKTTETIKESAIPSLPVGTKSNPTSAARVRTTAPIQSAIAEHLSNDTVPHSTAKPSHTSISVGKVTNTENINATPPSTPTAGAKLKSQPMSDATSTTVTPRNTTKHEHTKSDLRSTPKPALASVSVAYTNPRQPSVGASKVTTSLPISIDKLRTLLDRFRNAYESGDIDELQHLLADDAHSDQDQSRDAIVRSYQKLFSLTSDRHMQLSNLRWQSSGDTVQCEGQFGVHVKEKGRNWQSSYNGKISLRIEKRNGQLLITALNYSYAQ